MKAFTHESEGEVQGLATFRRLCAEPAWTRNRDVCLDFGALFASLNARAECAAANSEQYEERAVDSD